MSNVPGETATLMMHFLVHPDGEWVDETVAAPFGKGAGEQINAEEVDRMVDCPYARYFQSAGISGSLHDCQRQVDRAAEAGVDEIAFLQDFGMDHSVARSLR